MDDISFFIPGKPIPQGSKRWLPEGRMIEANKDLRPWRSVVTAYTSETMTAVEDVIAFPLTGPLVVFMDFHFARPKAHYGTGRNDGKLKTSAPFYNQHVPDLDKLIRAVQDGITDAGLWRDDSQVVSLHATKSYAPAPGVTIEMETLT